MRGPVTLEADRQADADRSAKWYGAPCTTPQGRRRNRKLENATGMNRNPLTVS